MKLTPTQEREYSILRDCGWEYDYTEYNGDVFMVRRDLSCDTCIKIDTMIIPTNGDPYRMPILKST